jgi:hypothetical protein
VRTLNIPAIALCGAALAGCGGSTSHSTAASGPVVRNAEARAQLLRASRDLQAYQARHGTYDVGGASGLHKLDRGTSLIDFVDGRQTSFFLAVNPPTTTTKWGYNYDHKRIGRSCGPGGTHCPPDRHW